MSGKGLIPMLIEREQEIIITLREVVKKNPSPQFRNCERRNLEK